MPSALDALSAAPPTERPDPLAHASPRDNNFDAAMKQLDLNEPEQQLYAMHLRNLSAGGVPNQGKTSTLFASTFEIEGRHYVIPTVWNGAIVSPDQALANAREFGLDNFPSYDSDAAAQQRYDAIHEFMSKDLQ